PSVSGWQWQIVAHPDDTLAAARRICLCALRLARKRDRREQRPLLRGVAQNAGHAQTGQAQLGCLGHLLFALSEKTEGQPRRQAATRTSFGADAAAVVVDDSEAAQGTRAVDDFGV